MLYSLDPELAPNTSVLSKHGRTFSIPTWRKFGHWGNDTGTLSFFLSPGCHEVSIFISIDPHHRQEDHGTVETEPFFSYAGAWVSVTTVES